MGMTSKIFIFSLFVFCLLALGDFFPATADAQTSRARAEADAQFTDVGTQQCLNCHGGESMEVMAETPHGNIDNPHTPFANQGCETCHGPGSLHVSRAAGGAGFPALLRFNNEGVVAEQTAACVGCHANDMGELLGMDWTGSEHDTDEMTCVNCHKAHSTESPLADPSMQRESCAGCHEEQIAAHPTFEDKGIVFDNLSCFDCHDVHQLISVK
jgi:DmsE family decaheme c-type cytochrome